MEKKTVRPTALIAGILFALLAVWHIVNLTRVTSGAFLVVLRIAALAVIVFALCTARKGPILAIGFGVMALLSLFGGIPRPFYAIATLAYLLAWGGAAFLSVVTLTEYLPKYRPLAQKLWFLPAILFALGHCIHGAGVVALGMFPVVLNNLINLIVYTAALLLAMLWAAAPERKPRQKEAGPAAAAQGDAYCSMGKHVVLLLFTCGVWNLIWIYRVTGHTNGVAGEEDRNPTTKLLLCLFVPFYQIYWTARTARRIDAMAAVRGISSDLSTLCTVLAIFVPIVPPILIQSKLNEIVTASPAGRRQAAGSTADELKKFKDLLDSGAITQEEFDAKKKELL